MSVIAWLLTKRTSEISTALTAVGLAAVIGPKSSRSQQIIFYHFAHYIGKNKLSSSTKPFYDLVAVAASGFDTMVT